MPPTFHFEVSYCRLPPSPFPRRAPRPSTAQSFACVVRLREIQSLTPETQATCGPGTLRFPAQASSDRLPLSGNLESLNSQQESARRVPRLLLSLPECRVDWRLQRSR